MTTVASSFSRFFDRMPIFSAWPGIHVHASPTIEVPDAERIHDTQRVQREWTVTTTAFDKADALTTLRIGVPGLTIVRVRRPQQDDDKMQPGTVALIRVSSNESRILESVTVGTKSSRGLRIEFKPSNQDNYDDDDDDDDDESSETRGHLLTEIFVRHASQIRELIASGGGDVVVDESVIVTRDLDNGGLFVALHGSRVFIKETMEEHLQLKELLIAAAGGGQLFFTARNVTALETFVFAALGDSSVHVQAPRMWAKTTHLGVVGGANGSSYATAGTVQVAAQDGLATQELNALVLGTGFGVIQSSPAVEFAPQVTCTKQSLHIEGSGRLDVAGVPTKQARVKIRESGRATLQPRKKMTLDCTSDGVVECVGSLPESFDSADIFRTDAIVETSFQDRLIKHRITKVTAPVAVIPVAPTAKQLFEQPHSLRVPIGGFRETFLKPFYELL